MRPWLSSLEDRTVPASLVVTSSLDDGSAGTLRAVINTADTNNEADTITFQAGVTAITLATGQLSLTTDVNNLTIDGGAGVTINGAAGASTTNRIFNFNVAGGDPTFTLLHLTLANGNSSTGNGAAILMNNDPVVIDSVTFNTNKANTAGGAISVAAASTLTVSNSTFSGNQVTAGTGGAIHLGAATTVNLTKCTFTSNTASGAGGVLNAATGVSTINVDGCTFTSNQGSTGGVLSGPVTNTTFNLKASSFVSNKGTGAGGALYTAVQTHWLIEQCQFINNSAVGVGGAIRMTSTSPTFNVFDSTFSGNTCTTNGGAIYFAGATTPAVTINGSTFSNNVAGSSGGALHIGGTVNTYTLNNCTLSGNAANGNTTATGGGAINVTSTAVLSINNSTIVNNTAKGVSFGGGIRRATATGTTNIISSIVALNTAGTNPDMSFSGAVTVNGGANLIGVADAGNFTLDTTAGANQTGTLASPLDPVIGPLQDNGGVTTPHTFTHALLSGSLGVNNGNQNGLPLDQAGNARPASGADIGSLESNPSGPIAPTAKATAPNVPPTLGTITVTVEYKDDIGINTATIDTNDVKLSGPGYPSAISPSSATPSGSGTMVTVTYVFATPVGGWSYLHNGKYAINMQANEVYDTDGPAAVNAGQIGSFTVAVPLPPLVVDNAGDTDDGIYTAGNFTLREAISLTNGSPGTTDTISFSASLNGQTITFGSQISITDSVIITGPGANLLTLDGTGTANIRAFTVDPTTAGAAVTISGLTIQNFSVTGDGGGINNIDAALTLNNMVIKTNTASTDGGAVNVDLAAGTLTITNSVLSGNTATSGNGGAITAAASGITITISNSSIRGNTAAGTSGDGGAIFHAGGTMTIDNSTLSGNTANNTGASFGGGAIYFNTTGTLTITNSTLANNHAVGEGGAIHIDDTAVTLNLRNSTVVGNTAGISGGGIDLRLSSVANLVSTIVAGNSAPTGLDFATDTGSAVNVDMSNIKVSAGITALNQTGVNLIDVDPMVDILANNGGFTLPDGTTIETVGLLTGSPVIGAGSNGLGLMFDQRGPGFSRDQGGAPDMGAFEFFSTVPSAKATAPAVPPALGTITVTVDYTDETGINTGGINTNDIRLTGPAFGTPAIPTSANFTGSGTMVTATYVFNAPAGGWQWFHNGKYSINMQAGEVFDTDGPNAVPAGVIGSFVVTMTLPNPLVVDNNGDTDDGNYLAGNLTLREAINLTNLEAGGNTITFAGALTGQTISVGSALKVTDGVTITGLGAANLTLSGGGTSRVFELNVPGAGGDVSLSGMTVTGGNATTGVGGGITLTDENLTLTGMVVTSNSITGAGGGIGASGAATITVGNSTISNNTASTTGAGIHLGGIGAITVNNSTLNANIATTTGGAIHTASTVTLDISDSTISNNSGSTGGGVRVINAGSTTTITRSTVSGNTATASGGGFYITGGTTNITYSTFSGNTAATSGGGVGMSSGTITLTNSTISGNIANGTGTNGGGGLSGTTAVMNINNSTITGNSAPTGAGGGIRKTSATGTVTLQSTIVGANTANTGNGQDIHGTVAIVVAGDSNLIQDVVNGAFTLSGFSNVTGLDPLLAGLNSNGGPTQTHSLQPGSPAFNAGSNLLGLMFDQRGSGNPRELGGLTDIGSYEGVSVIPSAKATAPDVPPALGTVTVTVIYSDETGINTTKIDTNDVKLGGPGYPVDVSPTSANFTGSGTSVTATYVFPTPVGGWDPLHNGKYTVTMQANEVFDTDAVPNPVFPGPIGGFNVAMPLPPLVVDKIGDDADGNYGPGEFTLREAIGLTNGSASTLNSISFAPSLFAGGAQTISLTGGQIVISKDVVITGPGANKLIIDGNNASRIFSISDGTTNKMNVTISGMTLTKGQSTGTISAATAGGGAIYIESENVTLDGMELHNNISASFGGAILSNSGSFLDISNSSLHNNIANGGDTTQGGGAIQMFFLSSGAMRIRNSTLAFNQAGMNTTTSVGGAIIGYSGVPNLIIENSTITQNKAHQAGGVRVFSSTTGVFNLTSSIVSGNTGSTSQPDFQTGSTPTNINLSLIGSTVGLGAGAVLDAFSTTNVGFDPMLGPIQNNGGPTQTMALLTGSPAINNGSNPAGLSFDQRGTGFARDSGGGVDIGAFEIQAATPPQVTGILVNNGAAQRSLVTSMKVSFSEPVNLAAGAFVLQRYANGTAGTIGLIINQVGNDVTLTFNNTGTILLDPGSSLPDGTYELKIVADNVTGTLGGGTLDGNKNGTAQGSPADDVTSKLHRLFGDGNGDGGVNSFDFALFRGVFGLSGPSAFDFNNDNSTNNFDFAQFRARFGLSGYQP